MPPITEQIKNINESVANINKATTDSGLQKLTPITSTALQEQPKVKFPEPTPATKFDTASDIIAGTGDSLMNQLQAEQKQATESAQKGYVDTLSQYTEALSSQTGLQGFLAQEEEKAGIRPIAEQVADLEGTINTERLARANLKRRLESTGGGLKSGANAEYQNFANESLFRETNAVIQLGVQSGRLSAAKQSAERLASAYYEQEQNQLNARKELVDANKDLFTQAEQRTFNLRYESAKRELDRKEEELKLTQTTKIDALKMAQMNGAPREVVDAISSASTPEEVLNAGGQYGTVDLLSREQLRASIASSWANYDLTALKLDSEKKKQKQLDEAIKNGEIVLDDAQKDIALKIAKEYEGESGEFKKQVGAYNRIMASAEDPSAAGDLALIFNYMKLLDPGSTVKEGEFATAQNSAGVPAIWRSKYNQIVSGERLSESTRNDFVDRSTKLYNSALDQQIDLENRYREQGIKVFGLPENAIDNVIQDIRATGTLSKVAFGIQLDNMSLEQRADLIKEGLLPVSTTSIVQ